MIFTEDEMINKIYSKLHPIILNWTGNHSKLVDKFDTNYTLVNKYKNDKQYYSDNDFIFGIFFKNNYFVKIYNDSYDDYRSNDYCGLTVDRRPCIKLETFVKYISVEKGDGIITKRPGLQKIYVDEIKFSDIRLDESNDWISTIIAWINRYGFRMKAEIKEIECDGQF